MCQKLAPIVAALLMAFGTAHARSPFDQILAGDIERIAICGFGDGGGTDRIPATRELLAACRDGEGSFSIEFRNYAAIASIVKDALRTAQVPKHAARPLEATALITVTLKDGADVQFLVLTDGELVAGEYRLAVTGKRYWLTDIGRTLCPQHGASEASEPAEK